MDTVLSPQQPERGLPDLSRWQELLASFHYPSGQEIFARITRKGPKATTEDADILNAITLWKINREIHIPHEVIETICQLTSDVTSPETALANDQTWKVLSTLLTRKGVGLPLASTILHFYAPQVFPIIDQRAYYAIKGRILPLIIKSSGLSLYKDYVQQLIKLRDRYNIPFEKLDQILYQLDKESGRKLIEKHSISTARRE